MNSKHRVKATIDFRGPDRLPYHVNIDNARFEKQRPQDLPTIAKLVAAAPVDIVFLDTVAPPGSKLTSMQCCKYDQGGEDRWGIIWKDTYVIRHPLEWNRFDLDAFVLPDPRDKDLFLVADQAVAENHDKYLLGRVWWTLFERMHLLRGFENALTDHFYFPEKFKSLREKIFQYDMAILDHWVELGVDGVYFSDDWGDNERLLINPVLWRTQWKPYYKKLFERARENKMDVWLHSDGNIFSILDDLVEIGLTVLNPLQPKAMPVDRFARQYAGRLCVFGGVDVQATLPFGTPQEVRSEVKHLIERLGSFNGGYIGGVSHSVLPDVPMENIQALFRAFQEFCLVI